MHFDVERFEYEDSDDYGIHMITDNGTTYTVLHQFRDDMTIIVTMVDLLELQYFVYNHRKGEDADE